MGRRPRHNPSPNSVIPEIQIPEKNDDALMYDPTDDIEEDIINIHRRSMSPLAGDMEHHGPFDRSSKRTN